MIYEAHIDLVQCWENVVDLLQRVHKVPTLAGRISYFLLTHKQLLSTEVFYTRLATQ